MYIRAYMNLRYVFMYVCTYIHMFAVQCYAGTFNAFIHV